MGFAVEHEQTSNNMITPRRDYCNPLSGIFGGIRLGVNANGWPHLHPRRNRYGRHRNRPHGIALWQV